MRVRIRPDVHRGGTPREAGSRAGACQGAAGMYSGTPARLGFRSTRYCTLRLGTAVKDAEIQGLRPTVVGSR